MSPGGFTSGEGYSFGKTKMMKNKIACILVLIAATSAHAQVATNAPDDGTLAKLTNGMTEAQIQMVLGVAGRARENAPLQTMEYDFNGLSVWVELAPSSEDKTPRAIAIRSRKDGLTIVAREAIRMKKWSEWVAAHKRKTNGIPNQASQAIGASAPQPER